MLLKSLIKQYRKEPRHYFWRGLLVLAVFTVLGAYPLLHEGFVIFGDIDFGFDLMGYLDRIYPLWNERRNTANFFNMTRLPFVGILVGILSLFGAEQLLGQVMILTIMLISTTGMYTLLWHIANHWLHPKEKFVCLEYILLIVVSVLAALFYVYNPRFIVRIQHIYLLLGHMMLPWIWYTLTQWTDASLTRKDSSLSRPLGKVFPRIFATAFFYMIAAGAVHYLFLIALLLVFRYVILSTQLIIRNKVSLWARLTGRFLLFGLIFFLLSSYWIFPYVSSLLQTSIQPANINTINTVDMFSRFADVLSVLSLKSYWWPFMDMHMSVAWWIAFVVIFSVILLGVRSVFKTWKRAYTIVAILLISLILGTGTYYEIFAPLTQWLVFDGFLAGAIGFIFREPNKLQGLIIFSYTILLFLGILQIWSWSWPSLHSKLIYLQKHMQDYPLLWYKKHRLQVIKNLLLWLGGLLSFLVVGIVYVYPFWNQYVAGYFAPIDRPAGYEYMIDQQLTGMTLMLPRYETVRLPGYNYAAVTWDDSLSPKPISSVDIFSHAAETYHPLEGAYPGVQLFYSYLDRSLSKGWTEHLSQQFGRAGVDHLIYHSDLLGQEMTHEKQLRNLHAIDNVTAAGQYDMMSVLSLSDHDEEFTTARHIFDGWRTIESISPITGMLNIWVDQNQGSFMHAGTGDVFIAKNELDVLAVFWTGGVNWSPFDAIDTGDPYRGWSKMRTQSDEWLWHMDHLVGDDWMWQGDADQGLVFSYVAQLPEEDVQGISLLTGLLTATALTPDVTLDYNDKRLQGSIAKGDSPLWQIAELATIDVDELMPYLFAFTVSGKDIHDLHMKLHWLDENQKQISVDYIGMPTQSQTFEKLELEQTINAPLQATQVQLTLASQRGDMTGNWSLDGLQVFGFSGHTIDNILIDTLADLSGDYQVFVRTLHAPVAGKLSLSLDSYSWDIDTVSTDTLFMWHELGTVFLTGDVDVSLTNIHGFNALNQLRLVPIDVALSTKQNIAQLLTPTRQQVIIDPAYQGTYIGKLPAPGSALQTQLGRYETSFDLIQDGDYMINFDHLQNTTGKITYNLYREDELIESIVWYVDENLKKKLRCSLTLKAGEYHVLLILEDYQDSLLHASDMKILEHDPQWFTKEKRDCNDCPDWQVTAHEPLAVEAGDYYLAWELPVDIDPSTHAKLVFWNKEKTLLTGVYPTVDGETYLSPQFWSVDDAQHEFRVSIPDDVAYVQLQFWSTGTAVIPQELNFEPYDTMFGVDTIHLDPRDLKDSDEVRWTLLEQTYHPLWKYEVEDVLYDPVVAEGFLAAYPAVDGETKFLPQRAAYFGLILSLIALAVLLSILLRLTFRRKKKRVAGPY